MMRYGIYLLAPLLLIIDCNCAPDVHSAKVAAEVRETAAIRAAAEQGDADAQVKLGDRYAKGTGVPEDLERAVVWFRKAAEQGNVDAQNNLGMIYTGCESVYSDCEGVSKDIPQAVEWFRKAADQGSGVAMHCLGALYELGDGLPKDLVAAYQWYELATANGWNSVARRDAIARQMTPEQLAEAKGKASPNGPREYKNSLP